MSATVTDVALAESCDPATYILAGGRDTHALDFAVEESIDTTGLTDDQIKDLSFVPQARRDRIYLGYNTGAIYRLGLRATF